jgi:hypothetical protein
MPPGEAHAQGRDGTAVDGNSEGLRWVPWAGPLRRHDEERPLRPAARPSTAQGGESVMEVRADGREGEGHGIGGIHGELDGQEGRSGQLKSCSGK